MLDVLHGLSLFMKHILKNMTLKYNKVQDISISLESIFFGMRVSSLIKRGENIFVEILILF